MQRRTIAMAALSLLLSCLLLAGSAGYALTNQPHQGARNFQIKLGNYGRLWLVAESCSSRSGGSIALIFQRALPTPRTRIFPDAGTYTILQRDVERSSTILADTPTVPLCE